jgi:hypothetical protein
MPASGAESVLESGKEIKNNTTVRFERLEGGYAVFTIGSGRYSFEAKR